MSDLPQGFIGGKPKGERLPPPKTGGGVPDKYTSIEKNKMAEIEGFGVVRILGLPFYDDFKGEKGMFVHCDVPSNPEIFMFKVKVDQLKPIDNYQAKCPHCGK